MLTITLHDRPLSAWVPGSAGHAARARFIRHHLHLLKCSETCFFSDEAQKQGRQFTDLPLLDVPEGTYELHGGDGQLYTLAVTPMQIVLEGVKIIDTPNKQHRYVPAEHTSRMAPLASTGRVIHAWTRQKSTPPPGGTYIGVDLEYQVLLPTDVPGKDWFKNARYLGTVDLATGAINE